MELSTREGDEGQIRKHILPWFGPMRMKEILPSHVREWVTSLQAYIDPKTKKALKPKTIQNLKNILSAIFTTALNDDGDVISIHLCKGVKTPPAVEPELTIVTPEQFDRIYKALNSSDFQLLIETAIESRVRWGELTELRANDLKVETGILTVRRSVVQLSPKYHPEGKRFLVKEYPKGRKRRRFKLSRQIVDKLRQHIETKDLGDNDLLFLMPPQDHPKPRLLAVPDPETLGWTEPNAAGRRYRHGTTSGYNAAKCRCEHCRAAMAIYRAGRRSQGKDQPRKPRTVDTDGHIPGDWFRNNIWYPALKVAGLGFHVRPHDLRHAHASWLLAGGADLQVVKDRMGHVSIATTQKYLHTLDWADETALDALARTRGRSNRAAAPL
jgi:integrase